MAVLAIIAKDEVEKLINIVSKYDKYFDKFYIAYDYDCIFNSNLKDNPKVELFKYVWKDDFSDKRNFLQSVIKEDYYVKIDTDDEILNVDDLEAVLSDARKNDYSIVYAMYNYTRDADGNAIKHKREFIIKNDKSLVWEKPVHENLVPKDKKNFKIHFTKEVEIEHIAECGHAEKSVIRNLHILLKEYNKDLENTDSRTICYIAKTFLALRDFANAKIFYEKHIKTSGWDEDRYQSWVSLALINQEENNLDQAVACCFEAMSELPEYADAYFRLQDIELSRENWEKSIEWARIGLNSKVPDSMIIIDEANYTWKPYISLAFAYLQIDQPLESYKWFNKAKEKAPSCEFIVCNQDIFLEAAYQYQYMQNFLNIFNVTKIKDKEKAVKLLECIPDDISNNKFIIDMKKAFLPFTIHNDKSIVIFCGLTPEAWSPNSVNTGIGGSEEACIRMSEQFVKFGYEPIVYLNLDGNDCTVNGVQYKHYDKFNAKDEFNIVISWRQNIFSKITIKSKFNLVWIHDYPRHNELQNNDLINVDKVVVLSEYHKSLLPKTIPNEKIFISNNGLVPEDFSVVEGIQRIKNRIIYASSYNRGLEIILEDWKKIREFVPDAEIHIYYGWEVYDKYMKISGQGMEFKQKMLKLFQQDGVFEHGRISHKELLKEYAKADFWAYPCTYEGEINCIAMTKAVACGCTIITNDEYVLGERSHRKFKTKDFVDELIKLLSSNIRDFPDVCLYIQENSWETIARDWVNIFKDKKHIETIYSNRINWTLNKVNKLNSLDEKIVDIGCNNGHLFEYKEWKNVTNVDIDKYNIPNFVQANAEELPFKDKEFDIAVMCEILEHIPDDVKALKEAKRVANRLVLTVPYEHEWREELKPFNTLTNESNTTGLTFEELAKKGNPDALAFHTEDNYEHLYHCRFYTPDSLKETLEKAGFKNIKIVKLKFNDWVWLGVEAE